MGSRLASAIPPGLHLPFSDSFHPIELVTKQPLFAAVTAIGMLITITLLLHFTRQSPTLKDKLPLPPSPPGAWPLLGHLPLLAYHSSSPDALFASLASTLGPVYLLRLGAQGMLVVNSDALARESLLRNCKAYADRLITAPWAVISEDGNSLAFAPYGEKWRTIRRAAHKILTPAAVDAMDARLELEADRLVAHLTEVGTRPAERAIPIGSVQIDSLPKNVPVGSVQVDNLPQNIPVGSVQVDNLPQNIPVGTVEVDNLPQNIPVGSVQVDNLPQSTPVRAVQIDGLPKSVPVGSVQVDNLPQNIPVGSVQVDNLPQNTPVRAVQVESLFQRYTANVIFSKTIGVMFERLDHPELVAFIDSVTHMSHVFAVGGVDEYVPDSGWFWGSRVVWKMVLWTAKSKMAAAKRVYDEFHQRILTNRLNELKARIASETPEQRAARDLCYAEELLVQVMEDDSDVTSAAPDSKLTMQQIKLIMSDLLLAGMDTTAGTLMWIAILLVNHPDIQRQAYDSLVTHCGVDPTTGKVRIPTLADVSHLTYIRSIVKETLRMIPIGPLGLPRATSEDTRIAGYHVPKGTQVVYNIEAIHERMYPASKGGKEFRPERWLDEGFGEGRGKGGVDGPDGIFTFGLGRRQCPGMHLANRELCLVTARLVAAFELRCGEPGKKMLSMEREFGLTAPPKHGALVQFVPRQ